MISLEGLTLHTGPAREAGYILRTFAHYVRDGLIPNLFPGGTARGPVPHGRRHALVLPRPGSLSAGHRRPRDAAPAAAHAHVDIAEHHVHGTRFGIGVDPADGLLAPGRRGLSAHLDGCEGGRLGRDAAPRQGGRDQRALVQRPVPPGAAGSQRGARRATAAPYREHADARARIVQSPVLESGDAATSSTSSTATNGDDPACRPEPDLRDLAAASRARARALGAGPRHRP